MATTDYATHLFQPGNPDVPNCYVCDRPEAEHLPDFERAIVLLNDARRRLVTLSDRFNVERLKLLDPETELKRIYDINKQMTETRNYYLGKTVELERQLEQFQVELSALLVARRVRPSPEELVDRAAAVAFKSFFGIGDPTWAALPDTSKVQWRRLATAVLELAADEKGDIP